jgi:hypothetical protein
MNGFVAAPMSILGLPPLASGELPSLFRAGQACAHPRVPATSANWDDKERSL